MPNQPQICHNIIFCQTNPSLRESRNWINRRNFFSVANPRQDHGMHIWHIRQKSPGASPLCHPLCFLPQKCPAGGRPHASSHLPQRTHRGAGPRAESRTVYLADLCFCPLPHQLSETRAPETSVRQRCCLWSWAEGHASAAMLGSTRCLFQLASCVCSVVQKRHL